MKPIDAYFRLLATVILLSFVSPAAAQRGLDIEDGDNSTTAGTRRALIVGISRYQNLPETQQLQFADDDAEMVYAFLKSAAGGPTEATLLRDEEATSASIIQGLTTMASAAMPGDEVIFYFAGHGDVERIAEHAKNGRLLAYDAPSAQNYVGNGGTIPISAVRDIMDGVIRRGAQVIILTDACRSGSVNTTLASGAQLTSAVLAMDWASVFRFVSSGPNELSEEDANLGHGLFTYYLLHGLLGAADGELGDGEDGEVDHAELDNFVTRQVRQHTRAQQPVMTGRPGRSLSRVSTEVTWDTLQALVPPRSETAQYTLMPANTATSPDRSGAAAADFSPGQIELVSDFQAALQAGLLMTDGGAVEQYESLRGQIPSSYFQEFGGVLATALENQVQAEFSLYMSGDPSLSGEGTTLLGANADDVAMAAGALETAMSLRGTMYVTYPELRTRVQFLRGWASMLEGDYESAVQQLGAVTPQTAFSLNALGFAHYWQDNPDAAAEALARAVEMAPNWMEPQRLQGFVAQYIGDWDAALEYYQAAALLAPENPRLQTDIGEVHAESGDLDAALVAWRRALDMDAELAASIIGDFIIDRLRIADRHDLVESIYAEALMRMPESSTLHVERADFYTVQERYDDAEADYNQALRLDPEDVNAHNNMGIMYEYQERYDEALAAYTRTAELAPDSPYPFRNRGDVYAAQDRYEEAVIEYQQALANDDSYNAARRGLGRMYAQLEQYDEAERYLMEYAEIAQSAEAYNDLGVFYEVDVREYGQAAAAYSRAIDIEPDALIHANLGDAYRRLGRYLMSAAAYEDALKMDPSQDLALEGLERLENHAAISPKDRTVEVISGRLSPDSPVLEGDGTWYEEHIIYGRAGDEVTILLRSEAFDPYLIFYDLYGGEYNFLGEDDDSGPSVNAVLSVTLPRDGQYSIMANTYSKGEYGNYEIVYLTSRPESDNTLGTPQAFRGALDAQSERLDDDNTPFETHQIPARAGELLDITLASAAFDTYLMVLDPNDSLVGEDDDGAAGTNSHVAIAAEQSGDYLIVANSIGEDAIGPYTLVVRRGSAAAAATAAATAAANDEVYMGELTAASDVMADNTRFEAHIIEAGAGEIVEVTMEANTFDTYLMVLNENGDILGEDDDGGGGTNSRLTFTAPASGQYLIVANCLGEDSLGPYTVTVRRN